jgi:putative DNA primase/helicase
VPRQCVFAGTTNPDTYLRDPTGNRRFWPIRCGQIDIELLEADRDQIWAEARLLYESYAAGDRGCRWWPEEPWEKQLFGLEQDDRIEPDPWDSLIAEHLDKLLAVEGQRARITTAQILGTVLSIDTGRRTRADETRVGQIIRRLGWRRPSGGGRLRIGGRRQYVYEPPESEEA